MAEIICTRLPSADSERGSALPWESKDRQNVQRYALERNGETIIANGIFDAVEAYLLFAADNEDIYIEEGSDFSGKEISTIRRKYVATAQSIGNTGFAEIISLVLRHR